MATEQQLKEALIKAHKAGDTKAAQLFADKIKQMRSQDFGARIDFGGAVDTPKKQEFSLGEKAVGAVEAAKTLGSGLLFGVPAGVIGAAEGVFGDLTGRLTPEQAQQLAAQYSADVTSMPETEAGQRYVKAIGDFLGVLPPVMGAATPLQAVGAGQALGASARVAPAVAAEAKQGASAAVNAAKAAVAPNTQQTFGMRSASAAEIPLEQVRKQQAADLPVPLNITKGMATKDKAQQSFEIETAKNPELGAELRQRNLELNQGINQNLDEMISQTGTKLPETAWRSETGNVVVTALQKGYEREKQKVKNAYDAARARGEMSDVISIDPLTEYLNSQSVDVTVAPVVGLIAKEAERLGVGAGRLDDGSFRLKPMTVEQSETLRQRVNELVDNKNGQDLRRASQIKQIIDQAQGAAVGPVFQSARKQRMQLANKYENLAIIDQLLDTKGKYKDQRIAAENVVNKAVINGSVQDLKNLRRVLSTAGEEGVNALNEVRAAVVRHVRDEATRNIGTDANGNPLISAKGMDNAIKALDRDSKLDILFGKKSADQLRTLNEVAKDVLVMQPGTGNPSGTAATILAAMDMVISSGAGMPAPILSALRVMAKRTKERKIKKKVEEALK
jgi:hypothetical protein